MYIIGLMCTFYIPMYLILGAQNLGWLQQHIIADHSCEDMIRIKLILSIYIFLDNMPGRFIKIKCKMM